MGWILFVDSSNSVTLDPEYDFKKVTIKVEDEHRMRQGNMFRYKWGEYTRWEFSVMFISSADQFTINNWHSETEKLLLMEEGGTQVFSVYLTNKESPIAQLIKPYNDQYRGKIELETY